MVKSYSRAAEQRLQAERLESREVPSIVGSEDVYSQPQLPGQSEIYPTAIQPAGDPLLQKPRGRYAIGTNGGGVAQVNVYDSKTGALLGIVNPFGQNYKGAVNVATGDVNGDGVEDIVVGAGAYHAPEVRVFDGKTLKQTAKFLAYSETFKGGVSVAVAKVEGFALRANIITGAGPGGGPHVKVFSGEELFSKSGKQMTEYPTAIRNFMAYDKDYRGGISVAGGDLNADGYADLVIGKKAGVAQVKAFSGVSGTPVLADFNAYTTSFTGGTTVAVGDVNGDGRAEIVTGAGNTGAAHVRVFDFATANPIAEYFAFDGAHGVNVALQDIDGDGKLDVVAGSGPNRPGQFKVLNAMTGKTLRAAPGVGPWFTGGLSVG